MFDFFNDMFGETKNCFFRYQVNSGKEIVVEGYKNLLLVSDEKIVLKVKNGEINILGCNLCVKEFSAQTIMVKGEIRSIENCCKGEIDEKK
ncbi:MAG: YabP/YqfC family sporulation protein [Christensenellales bacterium]